MFKECNFCALLNVYNPVDFQGALVYIALVQMQN
jgi:hypothetical protein